MQPGGRVSVIKNLFMENVTVFNDCVKKTDLFSKFYQNYIVFIVFLKFEPFFSCFIIYTIINVKNWNNLLNYLCHQFIYK